MKPTRPGAGIRTVSELQRSRRRLDRQALAVERALNAMQQGVTLHLQHEPNRPRWLLSNGWLVPGDTAVILINHPCVVAAGDALFPDTPAQTWRFVEPKEDSR